MRTRAQKKKVQNKSLARIVWAIEVKDSESKEWEIYYTPTFGLFFFRNRRDAESGRDNLKIRAEELLGPDQVQYRVSRMEVKRVGRS